MDSPLSSHICRFEGFCFDRRGYLFRCGTDGALVPVPVGSRALDILGVLIARAGEVVPKDEIIAATWSDRVVDDSNLTVQISALRRVLDRGRSRASYIQTVSGRGYRFVIPATSQAGEVDAGVSPSTQEPVRIFSLDGVKPSVRLFDAPTEQVPSSVTGEERRQLTVMICDLASATMLSSELEPEDLREIITAYYSAVAKIVAGFDGFFAGYMGDTVLAYFGYPRAHEDDAERAVRAGLGVVDAVASLDLKTGELRTRVGIATGLVVVSGGLEQEKIVTGEPPYVAARLKGAAEPDTVVIATSTHQLAGGLFEYRNLGPLRVEGVVAPTPAWQVLRPSGITSRFEALRRSGLTPLVGREEELDFLLRRWVRAKAGRGQVVLISGEPGIGKSRIVAALAERLTREPHIRLRYFCSPYHQDSALFPLIEQFGRAAGWARHDVASAKLEKLEVLLAPTTPLDEDVALIADLLSLPGSERHPLPTLSPQLKKRRILEALIRQFEGVARKQSVLMVFEDTHWIDPTSRELLDLTIERVGNLPVLLVVTFRPEFQPPWTGQPQVSTLTLNRLDHRDGIALVKQIAGEKALPDELVVQIADRTDGVPLFVEELTKSTLESGVSRLGIPDSLHDSLMARLDRLGLARRLAQIGAGIGREFPYTLLRAVSSIADEELQFCLGRLVNSGLMSQRGTPPDAVYGFKHTLVQETAHGSLLRGARQQLHAKIGEALEIQFPELMDSQPELFAQHYDEAGLFEKSVTYWGKAGRRSAARWAMAEAAALFQKALDQLATLTNGPGRQRQELELRSALGLALMAIKGFAAPETGNAFTRARELWQQLGSPSEFLQIPFAQSVYHRFRGELELAQRLDEELLLTSLQRDDCDALILGNLSAGHNLMASGRFALSQSHLQKLLALYDPVAHRSLVDQIGLYPHVAAQAILGKVLFCLGFSDQALARSNAAIAEARRLAHPPSLVLSLTSHSMLCALIGYNAALDDHLEEVVAMAGEQGFSYWSAMVTMLCGWAKVTKGDVAEGISMLRRGRAAHRASGAALWNPYHNLLLAGACEIAGRIDEALILLDDALRGVESTKECMFAAELHRNKGKLLLRKGNTEAADELYREALSIAEGQGAKLWELRALMSRVRLRCYQGRGTEARRLLALVYGWFTEGFDTPDLREAKAVLQVLDT